MFERKNIFKMYLAEIRRFLKIVILIKSLYGDEHFQQLAWFSQSAFPHLFAGGVASICEQRSVCELGEARRREARRALRVRENQRSARASVRVFCSKHLACFASLDLCGDPKGRHGDPVFLSENGDTER